MRTLDKKTLKKIKVETKIYPDNLDLKKMFISLRALKDVIKNKDLYSDSMVDKASEEIRFIRQTLKSIKIINHYNIPNREVETFYTIRPSGLPVEQKPSNQRKWILNRLKEKISEKRMNLKSASLYRKVCRGHSYFLTAGVHTEPNTFLIIKNNYKINKLRETKSPCLEENYIGLEIEFFAPNSQTFLEKLIIDYDLWNNAEIKYDSSIEWEDSDLEYDLEDYTGYEVTLLCREREVFEVIDRMSKVLFKMEAEINESCGFHVHFDMRNRNYKRVYRNLCSMQSLLFKMVDESRKENDYCRQVDSPLWEDATLDHYAAINGKDAFRKHETIEIRMHHATINKNEMTNWVKLLLKVVNHRKTERIIENLEEANLYYKLDSDIINFYSRRGVS